ncbi:hypothetical protein [Burkholderia ubonensis]|uniref:hypothetical protein n=1 Tax=Burkholderia ubonensis TaxID=101571 RepID=UPI0012FAD355|nr:hypothetical protein [Burkholderia ubonensis]
MHRSVRVPASHCVTRARWRDHVGWARRDGRRVLRARMLLRGEEERRVAIAEKIRR